MSIVWPLLATLAWDAHGHGFVTIRTEQGERLGSRNVIDWTKRSFTADLPNGVGYYYDPARVDVPYKCGNLAYDSSSAEDRLRMASEAGFPTALPRGSKFTLETWLTANHGGAGALWYACAAPGTSTPESYAGLDWKIMMPIQEEWPEAKRRGVAFSEAMPGWYAFAGGVCNFTYEALEVCDDCQLMYGGDRTQAEWQSLVDLHGNPPELAGGQLPTILRVPYQVPGDLECDQLVFSWMWRTPHMCVPREFSEKDLAVFDSACEGPAGMTRENPTCGTYGSDEIFQNCIDAVTVAGTPPTAILIACAVVSACLFVAFAYYQLRSLRSRRQRWRQHARQLRRTVLEGATQQEAGEETGGAKLHHAVQGVRGKEALADPLEGACSQQVGVIGYSRLLGADVDRFLAGSDPTLLPLASSKARGHVKVLFVVTLYTEEQHLVERTLAGIHRGIHDLIRGGVIRCWDEAVVCIVADGIDEMPDSTRNWLTEIGIFDPTLMTPWAGAECDPEGGKSVAVHCFDSLVFLSAEDSPMQAILLAKPENKGKLDSQLMAFVGIGERLMPVLPEGGRQSGDEALSLTSENRFLVLLDAGTVPKNEAVNKLLAPMVSDRHIGGTCGHMLPQQSDDSWWQLLSPGQSLAAFQVFEYQISHFLDKAFQCMFGYIQVLPGAFSAYRYDAIRRDQWIDGLYQRTGPLVEYFECGAPTPIGLNVRMVEDRLLPFLLVAKSGCKHTTWYQRDAEAVTDVPATLDAFLRQRRRWNNGAFATVVHLWLLHHRMITGTDHSLLFRACCTMQVVLSTFEAFVSALAPGCFYALIASAVAESGNWLSSNVGNFLIFAYLLTLIFQMSLHVDRAPQSLQLLRVIAGFYAFLMVFGLAAAVAGRATLTWAIIAVPAATVLVAAALHGRLVRILPAALYFVCWLPVVQIVVRMHGFLNFHVVSWKGAEVGSEIQDRLTAFRQRVAALFIVSNVVLIVAFKQQDLETFFTRLFFVIVGICSFSRLIGSITYLCSWLTRKTPQQSLQDLDAYLCGGTDAAQPQAGGAEAPWRQLSPKIPEGGSQLRSSTHLGALEFPRYAACIVVIAFHFFTGHAQGYPDLGALGAALGPSWAKWMYEYSGPDMVQLFFMLSGFVVTYAQYSRSGSTASNETVWEHWKHFVIRIYPTYFVVLVLTYCDPQVFLRYWRTIPANLLMMQTWGIHHDCDQPHRFVCSTQPQMALWYIANLSFCRLVFPIVYRRVARCSKFAFWWLAFGAWCLHLLEPTFWSVCYQLSVPLDTMRAFGAHPLFHLNVFVQGMFLGRAFVDMLCAPHPSTSRMHVVTSLASRCWFVPALGVMAYVFVCCCYQESWWLVRRAVVSAIWAVLIFGLAAGSDPLSWVFKARPFVWGGKISYEIYVLQASVYVALNAWFGFLGDRAWIVYPFALHALAVACHFLVQEPVVAWLTRRAGRRAQSKNATASIAGTQGAAEAPEAGEPALAQPTLLASIRRHGPREAGKQGGAGDRTSKLDATPAVSDGPFVVSTHSV